MAHGSHLGFMVMLRQQHLPAAVPGFDYRDAVPSRRRRRRSLTVAAERLRTSQPDARLCYVADVGIVHPAGAYVASVDVLDRVRSTRRHCSLPRISRPALLMGRVPSRGFTPRRSRRRHRHQRRGRYQHAKPPYTSARQSHELHAGDHLCAASAAVDSQRLRRIPSRHLGPRGNAKSAGSSTHAGRAHNCSCRFLPPTYVGRVVAVLEETRVA